MRSHVVTMWLFDFYNVLFNFCDRLQSNIQNNYQVFKYQYFDNKILKLGYLSTSTGRYFTIYNIDHPVYLLYYRMMSYIGWDIPLLDYNDITRNKIKDSIIITRFIKDNRVHHIITDKSIEGYFQNNIVCDPLLYCTLNDNIDLTHMFSDFLPSLYYNEGGIRCKWYVDAICEFVGVKRQSEKDKDHENVLKYMLDDDNYEEKIFKDNDIILIKQ